MPRPQMKSRRVLGVDPGYDRLGIAVVEGDSSRPTLVWSTCVIPPKGAHANRLAAVYTAIQLALEEYTPSLLAIETVYFSSNKKSALAVAEARGAVLAAVGAAGVVVQEYGPGQIKLAVTGYGSADKAAIARMLPRLISIPSGTRLDDELDAIAVAMTGLTDQQSTGLT
jgi:crossover junction endodeoxyribonuclease RuvC